jgi:hypothetical protein
MPPARKKPGAGLKKQVAGIQHQLRTILLGFQLAVFSPTARDNDALNKLYDEGLPGRFTHLDLFEWRWKFWVEFVKAIPKGPLPAREREFDEPTKQVTDATAQAHSPGDIANLEAWRDKFREYTDKMIPPDIRKVRWKKNGWLHVDFHFMCSAAASAVMGLARDPKRNVPFKYRMDLQIKMPKVPTDSREAADAVDGDAAAAGGGANGDARAGRQNKGEGKGKQRF